MHFKLEKSFFMNKNRVYYVAIIFLNYLQEKHLNFIFEKLFVKTVKIKNDKLWDYLPANIPPHGSWLSRQSINFSPFC